MNIDEANRIAREKGVSRPLYAVLRAVLVPLLTLWFRISIAGREHIPLEGAAIIAPNHKSFWDSFFIGVATPRPIRYMAKVELFEGTWYGRLLLRLGAFPVRRGESDEEALETARHILRNGELLALFPEGTRVRDPDRLGDPRRGAARLAIEFSAPIIPAAISGTDHLFLGPIPKPKRVQIAFAEPVSVEHRPPTPEAAGEVISEEVWPVVESEYKRLISKRGVAAAALAVLGIGSAAYAQRKRHQKTGPARKALESALPKQVLARRRKSKSPAARVKRKIKR
jgi:1-acyl-sn-glycerol-3-phosphate acyltransferase